MKLISGTVLQSASRFTVKILVVAAATVGGGALVSSSVFAALTAEATGSTSVEAGTIKWVQSTATGDGFSTGISGVAPGDIQNRYVNLANTGTLDGLTPTLTIVGSGVAALTNILKVNIQKCTVAWAAGSCSGTASDVLGSVGTPVLVSSVTGSALTNLNITSASLTNRLKITITVGPVTEVTTNGVLPSGIQGATSTLAWTFTLQQRAAVTVEG